MQSEGRYFLAQEVIPGCVNELEKSPEDDTHEERWMIFEKYRLTDSCFFTFINPALTYWANKYRPYGLSCTHFNGFFSETVSF
jgi:hypothetical protein